MASLLSSPLCNFSPTFPGVISRNFYPSSSINLRSFKRMSPKYNKSIGICFALVESDSPNAIDQETRILLQEISNSFVLPADFFKKLPNDLRLDLNDAAFDLANGPVMDECGQELGETLLNLSKAWEQADTSTSQNIASKLPAVGSCLSNNVKAALGKRLISSGRRFQSMGQYGQGELQRIANAMIEAGKVLSAYTVVTSEAKLEESRTLKFGELQVELTPGKANVGAAIGVIFGILSWEISQGIQRIPESSLEYANDNALLLAKSLRGALLALFYSSAFLSMLASVGLILLGRQLSSRDRES